MPSTPFRIALLAWFARITLSGICSIRPAPNTGVGIRKITLPSTSCASKSGCPSAHPGASARPAIVNKAWTPPSRVPSGFLTNLASRTGPSAWMNGGMRLVAPFEFANATWGLANGLVPPVAGCAWQPAQLSRFIVGPRPSSMLSTCSNSSLPTWKNASSAALRPAIGSPASEVPKRTPGSLAIGSSEDAVSTWKRKETAAAEASTNGSANLVFTGFSLPPLYFLATRRFPFRRCFDYRRQKKNTTRKDFSGPAIQLSGQRDKIRQRDKNRTTREIRCAESGDAFAQVGLAHLGVIQQVAGRAGERNRTRFHDVAAAREFQREPRVLLHQQDRHALSRDLAHNVEDLRHHQGREAHRRLVQQQQFRPRHQRARNGEHLLLAAGERAGDLLAALPQARKACVLRLGVAAAERVGAHGKILLHRELAENAAPLGHHHQALARQRVHR